jgi:hypothetical protein
MAEEVAPWENSGLDPGTKAFTITLELREKDPKRLLPGVTANVEMVAQHLARVIYLPKECVFDQGDRHVVYRWVPISGLGANRWPPEQRRGRVIPTTVIPGRENNQYVVIRHGLRPGERVATQKPMVQASS